MPQSGHDPEWPDKAMFAALLLIVGGAIGLLVEILRLVATVNEPVVPGILEDYPTFLSALFAGLTLLFGILALRTHAMLWGLLGVATAFASLAYFGFVPFLGLVALAMLIKSKLEGEETRNDGITLHASQWPDKAMAASLFLFVGGAVILVQAILILLDNFQPVILKGMEAFVVPLDLAAALFCFGAAREVYKLRRSWLGTVGAIACIATLGLYALGPALGVLAIVLLRLADKEGEFDPEPVVRGERQQERLAKKAARKGART
ncbi:MAG: hypothetical protein AABX89_03610 [Candidatus Thermoplasmatota archaeon]